MEGVSEPSAPDCAESFADSSAVANDAEVIIELARDSDRSRRGGAGSLKDDGGGDDVDVASAGVTSATWVAMSLCVTGRGGCTDGEGSALTIV